PPAPRPAASPGGRPASPAPALVPPGFEPGGMLRRASAEEPPLTSYLHRPVYWSGTDRAPR
ncbi:MAG: hypothetical protein K2X11_22615, partial [Acetobacteraceae bacterium]|nr:hypothetical protein [Acetobacteraceae bacterium]